MTTGRVAGATKLLQVAAAKAIEHNTQRVQIELESKEAVFVMRQCCYAAQRNWVKGLVARAKREGLDVEQYLDQELVEGVTSGGTRISPALWTSASFLYRLVEGKHYLVILFSRSAAEPFWDDVLRRLEPVVEAREAARLLEDEDRR